MNGLFFWHKVMISMSLLCNFSLPSLWHLETLTTPAGQADFHQGEASITIQPNDDQSLMGKHFRIYRLLDVVNAVGHESVNYTLNPTYAPALQKIVGQKLSIDEEQVTEYQIIDYLQSLNQHVVEGALTEQTREGHDSDYRYFVEELRNLLMEMNLDYDEVKVTALQADGSFAIVGLDDGYYLVDEITNVQDQHAASSLCMVGTANPVTQIVIKSDYPVITKKIQEDDHVEEIGNNGWNDIADYEIGQIVPYRFESQVPNMNGYDTYFFGWHDRMHEALTFQADSVEITIMNAQQTYTLSPDEFVIEQNPQDGDTFCIVIDDLKALVDREFPAFNEDQENRYDQTIVVQYQAVLNDLAAYQTGRPGFENDIQLEFSNNPDSDGEGQTGRTPWDTVVCFTYQLDGVKLNDHDQTLADAHFRLYLDADCTTELAVKKAEVGYIVMNGETAQSAAAVDIISDESGLFTIYGLDSGTYYLKEVEAPDGYRRLQDPIVLNIQATYTEARNTYVKGESTTAKTLVSVEATAKVRPFLAGIFQNQEQELVTDPETGAINLTIVNTVGSKLPVTGSQAMLWIIGSGIGLMTISLKRNKSKKRRH